MYKMMTLINTVRIDPILFNENIKKNIIKELRNKLEGKIDKKIGCIVAIYDIESISDGYILYGDGGIYYDVTFKAIVFTIELQEIVEGTVLEIVNFGLFISIGPIDGLVHISQINDEFMSYDSKNCRLSTKNGKKSISEGDKVRARVVAISINEHDQRESKIGLTMRQTALGNMKWIIEQYNKNNDDGDIING